MEPKTKEIAQNVVVVLWAEKLIAPLAMVRGRLAVGLMNPLALTVIAFLEKLTARLVMEKGMWINADIFTRKRTKRRRSRLLSR